MAFWSEFTAAAPDVAAPIRALLYQYGPGLAYLATVRPDGGPRIHPVSPVIADGGLFCFLIDSPKRRDLEHDGRYALHAYPAESSDDEAYLSGRAWAVPDGPRLRRVAEAGRAAPRVDWRLFELTVEVAMVVRRPDDPRGSRHASTPQAPSRLVWRDEARLLERVS